MAGVQSRDGFYYKFSTNNLFILKDLSYSQLYSCVGAMELNAPEPLASGVELRGHTRIYRLF